jgi:tubulin-specific chaperone A
MADPRIKALRIKTGVVKRLVKEKVMYEKEAGEQRQRIQIFKDQGSKLVASTHICAVIFVGLHVLCFY